MVGFGLRLTDTWATYLESIMVRVNEPVQNLVCGPVIPVPDEQELLFLVIVQDVIPFPPVLNRPVDNESTIEAIGTLQSRMSVVPGQPD